MTPAQEFDDFYDTTARHLLAIGLACTSRPDDARAALERAYAHAWTQWPTLRRGDPARFVRSRAADDSPTASGSVAGSPGGHGADAAPGSAQELLTAMDELAPSDRRLLVLQTLADLDLADAARECELTPEAAADATDAAIARLSGSLGVTLDQLLDRLNDLIGWTPDSAPEPSAGPATSATGPGGVGLRPAAQIRSARRTRSPWAALLVAAVIAAVLVVSGVVVSANPTSVASPGVSSFVDALGGLGRSGLLVSGELSRFKQATDWRTQKTRSGPIAFAVGSLCARSRNADPTATRVWSRHFVSTGRHNATADEVLEVSRTVAAAKRAEATLHRWYADCQVPRVQLARAFKVPRQGESEIVLRYWRYLDPLQAVDVGLTRVGRVNTVVEFHSNADAGPFRGNVVQFLEDAVALTCSSSGGRCGGHPKHSRPILPPPTHEKRGFLSVVDLPAVSAVYNVWSGTRPRRSVGDPAASLCDADQEAQVRSKAASASARTYVIPQAEQLPATFGLTQTVLRFATASDAQAFARRLGASISGCRSTNPTASVSAPAPVLTSAYRTGANTPITGSTWSLAFRLDNDQDLAYRFGIVRYGHEVSEVSFTPVGRYDMTAETFSYLLGRAGERLAELP